MTESKFETVSSIADNYQQSDDAFNEVINDAELSDTWQRYHLIGDVIRKDTPDVLNFDLSDSIADAIAQEPTILAPAAIKSNRSTKVLGQLKTKVIQLAKPFGQVAIAASAAGLMVLGVQQNNIADNETIAPNQIIQTNPIGGFAEPVSLNYQQNDRMAQKQAFVQQQRRFQALLADHKQQVKFGVQSKEDTQQEKAENLPK